MSNLRHIRCLRQNTFVAERKLQEAGLYYTNGSPDEGSTGESVSTCICVASGVKNILLPHQRIFAGKDVVVQAHTGSGKTLVYSLPILSHVNPSHAAIQAVIVVPTRELGLQVTSVLKKLASGCPEGKIGVMSVVEGSKNRRFVLITCC